MAEGLRSMNPIIKVDIKVVQEGDRTKVRVEQNAETNINAANIEQLNLQQQEVDNEATEGVEEQDEIIHGVDALNLSSPVQKKDPKKTVGNRRESHSVICGLLLDHATILCRDSKYMEADSKLEKLVEIQGKDVGVYASLLIAEVSIQLRGQKKAKKAIKYVVRLSKTSPSDVNDVFHHACDYLSNKSFVRAIVLLRISSEMYKIHPSLSPDAIVEGIFRCASKMNDALTPMIELGDRSKTIALDFGLPFMLEMVHDLRAVEACKPKVTATHVAECFNWIGFNYYSTNELEKGIDSYTSGLDAMKHQFDQKALKYKIYCTLLDNVGKAYNNLGKYEFAKDYYLKAINAHNDATDYSNADEKRESIERIQNNLQLTRELMK